MVISGNSFGLRGIKLEHNKNNVTPPPAPINGAPPILLLFRTIRPHPDPPFMTAPSVTPSCLVIEFKDRLIGRGG
jgi:hypothetical protein